MRTFTLLALLLVGCAEQAVTTDSPPPAGGGGGKSDSGSDTSWTLTELGEDEQAFLRAADAECLHVNHTDDDTYMQGVKLFCLPRGGVAAPIDVFLAITPEGEADGAYKVYDLGTYSSDVPANVEFHYANNRATYTFDLQTPQSDGEDLVYKTSTVTVTAAFSGSSEDPSVAASYSTTTR
jgi:hypothetical protein